MKIKTIERTIRHKFNTFLDSIKDKETKKLVEKGTIITGGCIVSMLLNQNVNDYDLYFKDLKTTEAVAKYYVKEYIKNKVSKMKAVPKIEVRITNDKVHIYVASGGVDSETADNEDYRFFEQFDPGSPEQENYIEGVMDFIGKGEKDNQFSPLFVTSNAITLSDKIQVIFRFYGNPEEIHKNYDFVHCTNYWTSWDKNLVLSKEALIATITKELVYVGSLYPICSILRLRKFINKGWTINAGQMFKICYQISKLNLEDPAILYDQLMGVDVAYFIQLITMLKEAQKDNVDIDYIYICDLIDKIW